MAKPPPQVSLLPSRGFINSVRRQDVPVDGLTGPSHDWLVSRGRLKRRAGSAIQGDTLTAGVETAGLLESKWGAKARRMLSVALKSLSNAFPTWLTLYADETHHEGQLAWRSTNGTPAVRVLGGEFGAYHYGWPPTRLDGIPTFRVMPYAYDNEHGGMTVARLSYAKARRFNAGGSRSLALLSGRVAWPAFSGTPQQWDGGFNDSTSSGNEVMNVRPLGLVPPLQMPTVHTGTSLGASVVGPWKGSDAFYYTVTFENEHGEMSMYPIPRPANSTVVGFPGFGYCNVSSAQPTFYYDSLLVSGLPIGPPGTVKRHLWRSNKVDLTGTTTIKNFPAPDAMYRWATIDNNVDASFVARDGNDDSLDVSLLAFDLRRLIFPYRARGIGYCDGRYLLGGLKASPLAMFVAPWANGGINAPIDSATLYSPDGVHGGYYVALTPTNLVLRSVLFGVATDISIELAGRSLRDLVDLCSVRMTAANVTIGPICYYSTHQSVIFVSNGFGSVATCTPGSLITGNASFTENTKVLGIDDSPSSQQFFLPTGVYIPLTNVRRIFLDRLPLATSPLFGATTVVFSTQTIDATNPAPWSAGVVPGADGAAAADELLRTRVDANCTWANNGTALTVVSGSSASAPYISPGMRVYNQRFTVGAEVTAVSGLTVTVDTNASAANGGGGGGEAVTFAYSTGDSTVADSFPLFATGTITYNPNGIAGDLTTLTKWADASKTHDADAGAETSLIVAATGGTPVASVTETATFAIDTCVTDNPYAVRVTIRAKGTNTSGTNSLTVTPVINGTPYPTPLDVGVGAFNDYSFLMTTDPTTSLPWVKADINTYSGSAAWGVQVEIIPDATGHIGQVDVSGIEFDVLGPQASLEPGYVHAFANCWPAPLFFRKSYLDKFAADEQAVAWSVATPGRAQNAINSWQIGNRSSAPASFGPFMDFADLGAMSMVFYLKGRSRFWNPRTGTTRNDEDYTLSSVSWTTGAVSPYAVCSGNGWAIACGRQGFYVCEAGPGEALISGALYNPEGTTTGALGELEYAIHRSGIAAESGTDDYAVAAQVHDGVLSVRYLSGTYAAGTWTAGAAKEVRYDFSPGIGRTGIAEVLQADGSPYPWSPPQTLPIAVSCHVTDATGEHHYAARNSNAGTADGRVDEVDTGTADNGTAIRADGYSGVRVSDRSAKVQLLRVHATVHKGGDGLSVSASRQPGRLETEAEWDPLVIPGSGADDFGRHVVDFEGDARANRAAEQYRISDDGTVGCPEVSTVNIDVNVNEDVTE